MSKKYKVELKYGYTYCPKCKGFITEYEFCSRCSNKGQLDWVELVTGDLGEVDTEGNISIQQYIIRK